MIGYFLMCFAAALAKYGITIVFGLIFIVLMLCGYVAGLIHKAATQFDRVRRARG